VPPPIVFRETVVVSCGPIGHAPRPTAVLGRRSSGRPRSLSICARSSPSPRGAPGWKCLIGCAKCSARWRSQRRTLSPGKDAGAQQIIFIVVRRQRSRSFDPNEVAGLCVPAGVFPPHKLETPDLSGHAYRLTLPADFIIPPKSAPIARVPVDDLVLLALTGLNRAPGPTEVTAEEPGQQMRGVQFRHLSPRPRP
jgi:hypothetical protein